MNDFSDYFWNHSKQFSIHKWHHYFDIYERHFAKYKSKKPIILEIGVSMGGSLNMWNHYFKENCTIYGVDINPECKKLEELIPNVKIFIGDQNDNDFLHLLKREIPQIDILVDDGSHVNSHIIKTFEVLYPNVSFDGTYLIEDMHTSYWNSHGGGLLRQGTSIEYLKTLIDKLNAKHHPSVTLQQFSWSKPIVQVPDTSFSNVTNSLHFYDSIAVIEKHKTPQIDLVHSERN